MNWGENITGWIKHGVDIDRYTMHGFGKILYAIKTTTKRSPSSPIDQNKFV